jgi:hypothetical protein
MQNESQVAGSGGFARGGDIAFYVADPSVLPLTYGSMAPPDLAQTYKTMSAPSAKNKKPGASNWRLPISGCRLSIAD